jgi:hypothetical protein
MVKKVSGAVPAKTGKSKVVVVPKSSDVVVKKSTAVAVKPKSTAERVEAFGGIDRLFKEIEENDMSFRKIAESIGCSGSGLVDWLEANHGVQYAKCLDRRYEGLARSIIEIADQQPNILENGATDSGAVAHQRLRIDARKWIVSKLLPKVYGDKVTQEITGANGGAIKTEMAVSRKLSKEEILLELAARGLPTSVLIGKSGDEE